MPAALTLIFVNRHNSLLKFDIFLVTTQYFYGSAKGIGTNRNFHFPSLGNLCQNVTAHQWFIDRISCLFAGCCIWTVRREGS